MVKVLLVGAGGFLGAVSRYLVSGFVQNLSQSINFPYGTLTVNIVGCFFLGLLSHLAELNMGVTAEVRLLIMIGFLGSFTTYSTFCNETMNLMQDQRFYLALINVGVHLFLGLSAVLIGRFVVTMLWR
ncbi:MAG: fluoride efflux transporter CrcB [Thermodesulfobacteriota bacterium]|nr:fluoride efflux transporter CrcB [Thermodesulfobacteriota bacterium]